MSKARDFLLELGHALEQSLDGGRGLSRGRVLSLKRRLPHFTTDSVAGAGLHVHEERPDVIVHELLTLVRELHP